MQNVFHRPLNSAPVTCLSTPLPVIFRHASYALVRGRNLPATKSNCSCNFVKQWLSIIRFVHATCTTFETCPGSLKIK